MTARSGSGRREARLRVARRRGPAGSAGRPRVGLALAGGGPLGAVYELGTLAALSEALAGIDFNALDVYVGVSAGSFIAAGLANGVTPGEMCRMFVESDAHEQPFDPSVLLRPALREYARRIAAVPPVLLDVAWSYLSNPFAYGTLAPLARLGRAIPTGIFDNQAIHRFLGRAFAEPGRTNDFRKLAHELYLIATDLDSGASVQFGAPGHDDVPISLAVQASAALPGVFPPVEIGGRCYVDGALKKTLHASVALARGAGLVLGINPLVPFDAHLPRPTGGRPEKLVEGGLPAVLAQTFRAIIHSRMQVGMRRYETEYPDSDIVLFEPNRNDAEMFFTNIFSYASRRRLAEHAYQKTRKELLERRHALAPVLARHGIAIRVDVLTDSHRHLVKRHAPHKAPIAAKAAADRLTHCLDDLARWVALAPAARRPG
ncbi:MAG: patatin-like phospholipase family protein [Burkholderiales bacterium]|nr:patatin-like phospholipase family protein [Burkholderiales bacterium]